MIGVVTRNGRIGQARLRRARSRVEAITRLGDRPDAGSTASEPGRALVVTSPQPEPRPPVRLAPSAAFIAQLAAAHLGNLAAGDRRVRRDNGTVAPRATGVYRAADRLSSEIEPGFLMRRDV